MQTFSSAASQHKHSNPDVTLSHYVCVGFLHLHAWFSCWFLFFHFSAFFLRFWDFLRYFEIFWDFLRFFELLRYFEIFWDILRYFEIFWDILRYFEIFWDIFKNYFEIFWDILRYFEIFWDILRYFEIFWAFLRYILRKFQKNEKNVFFGPIPNSIFSSVQLNFQLSNSTFNCPIKFSIVQLN